MKRTLFGTILAVASLLPAGARMQDTCAPDVPELSATQYLRALSLDLRGVTPALDEYGAIVSSGEVDESLIDGWLASDEFAARAVRHHRELLWPSISNVRLVYNRARLQENDTIWWRRAAARYYRADGVQCLNEPATFDADGSPVTRVVDGVPREGYVMVRPYWAPDTEIKVCAFDAQTARRSPAGNDCASRGAYPSAGDRGCGCGPNLNWCDTAATHTQFVNGFAADLERRIAALVREDRPYGELFTSRRAFVNGPIVHFWKWLANMPNIVRVVPVPVNTMALPDLAYTDVDTWVEITLPEQHAGILTSPLYLLRFQTNRARANRFYDAFLCQPFQPPDGGIPLSDPAAALVLDLQERPGCKYCHAILEPASSYWGRWTETGAGWLDPALFPATNPACEACASRPSTCSSDCRLYYVTRTYGEEEEPYIGMLRAYEFRRDEHVEHIERGPKMLVDETIADGRLPACVTRRTTEWLLGREPGTNEGEWLASQTAAFLDSEMSLRTLVRSIVTSETYRRVR